MNINEPAQQNKFAEIIGVSEAAVSGYLKKGVLKKGETYREWLLVYCKRQRVQASNLGGDKQSNLAQARINDLEATTRLKHLDYLEKIEALVPVQWAQDGLIQWAGYANREYTTGLKQIILQVESKHSIVIDAKFVEKNLNKIIKAIQDQAKRIADAMLKNTENYKEDLESECKS